MGILYIKLYKNRLSIYTFRFLKNFTRASLLSRFFKNIIQYPTDCSVSCNLIAKLLIGSNDYVSRALLIVKYSSWYLVVAKYGNPVLLQLKMLEIEVSLFQIRGFYFGIFWRLCSMADEMYRLN